MTTIWKYTILIADEAHISIPLPATILDAALSDSSTLNVWAIVTPDAPKCDTHLSIRGTGHELGQVGPHITTVTDGEFVWHIFEGAIA